MKSIKSMVATVAIFIIFSSNTQAGDLFSGSIFTKDGRQVDFEYLGEIKSPEKNLRIIGKYQGNDVDIELSAMKKISFIPDSKDVQVVNKYEKIFIIEDAIVGSRRCIKKKSFTPGCLNWVWRIPDAIYLNDITGGLQSTSLRRRDITHITIGQEKGALRMNKRTGIYYPDSFVFDPFTGEKLTWSSKSN